MKAVKKKIVKKKVVKKKLEKGNVECRICGRTVSQNMYNNFGRCCMHCMVGKRPASM